MKSMRAWLALSMLVLGLSAQAAPVVVYEAAPSGTFNDARSDVATPGSPASTSFSVSTSAPVLRIQWWGYDELGYSDPLADDDFSVVLGSTSFSTTGARQLVGAAAGVGLYLYTLDVASAFNLTSGLATDISIINNNDNVGWFWRGSDNMLSLRVIADVTTSTVPEPAGLAFLAAALALAAARRRA